MPRAGRPARSGSRSTRWSIPPSSTGSTAPRRPGCGSTSSCAASAACGRACRACRENIRVKSIIGRFLEHGRIVCFGNGHGLPSHRGQGVHLLGRLDAAQSRPARRGAGADREPDRASPGARRDHGAQPARTRRKAGGSAPTAPIIASAPIPSAFSAHTYFMTNPSLSGRGSALHRTRPPPRLVSERGAP